MGYTNYWNQPDFTDSEWKKIKDEYEYIKEMCCDFLFDETNNEDEIIFNGLPDHETFCLYKTQKLRERSIYNPLWINHRFNFCKTAGKPYDIAVWHLLYFANNISKSNLKISRDW